MGYPETKELSDVPRQMAEIESLMWQTPIDLPNDISQLPAEEEPTENENQLHLQLP